ncbi:restriction endonuclease subunit S [Allocoleopsis franciscana]|uniref:Restriction endonuclease S subunit n=1 Tax=Allocoleopsis franciscana PCC 7113 TaxID=1173027 RepID=K9WL24_9CYAN|nr:restriction endonuclease subunit S [Allocoleopsis franciscana]AFZ20484.1 restriction endonuclease S subunit [Allocoleopsis franciscana PCC 7113]
MSDESQTLTKVFNSSATAYDSVINWVETIPSHWSIELLKFHLLGIEQGWSPQSDNFPADENEWGVLKVGAVNGWEFNPNENKRLPADLEPLTEYEIKPGDLLVSRANTPELVGSAALVKQVRPKLLLCDKLYRLKINCRTLCPEYLVFYLRSPVARYEFERDATGASSSMQNISQESVKNLFIPVPPVTEQRKIASYVDRQTAKIDTLITAKQRLLELLTEKRRSLITHAVTRGLNPDAPLRDSGIEWLGEIPAHWNIERLRWFIKTLEQGWSPQAEEREPGQEEWGVLKLNAVKDGQFDPSKAKALPASIEIPVSLEIRSGDFLITRANTPELVGDICYVHETRSQLILSDLIYRLRLDESKLDGKFLSYFLQAPSGRLQIEADARGSSASMVKISQGHILDWLLILPPLSEQQAIVAYIESEISKLANLKEATEHTMELLQERRVALISAAVTGQIRISA